mmetsp:Transcript_76810/g.217352  ORF Transcript_76810/g.217352 Transcript_76810/m.217352 type:complete len:221 (+) Transcript_76810:2631-3293(+)
MKARGEEQAQSGVSTRRCSVPRPRQPRVVGTETAQAGQSPLLCGQHCLSPWICRLLGVAQWLWATWLAAAHLQWAITFLRHLPASLWSPYLQHGRPALRVPMVCVAPVALVRGRAVCPPSLAPPSPRTLRRECALTRLQPWTPANGMTMVSCRMQEAWQQAAMPLQPLKAWEMLQWHDAGSHWRDERPAQCAAAAVEAQQPQCTCHPELQLAIPRCRPSL